MTRPRRMICACCNAGCMGRQWWNRDTGFGLCPDCAKLIEEKEGPDELRSGYGVRGTHFDVGPLPELAEADAP